MAKLIGRIIGVVVQLLMLPFVIIFAIPAGVMKARRAQAARLLFSGAEQSLLGKAQRAINMDESGLMSPDKDLLAAAKCIENARVQYQLIKSRERFDETFSEFLAPLLLQCNVNDWRKVFDFFELDSFGIERPNQDLGQPQRDTGSRAEAQDKSTVPTQTRVQSGTLPDSKEKKLKKIARCVVDLTSNALSQIDLELSESNAISLVQSITHEMNDDLVAENDAMFIGLQIVEYLGKNALENEEYDALCMFALSVVLGGKAYAEENHLSEDKSEFVLSMTNSAREIVVKNMRFIQSAAAKAFIDMKLHGHEDLPSANKNNHFYLRDASKEGLQQPIHIHFDSYEPALKMGNKVLPNPCTFLVTVDSPEFSPRGLTCRVSGINHKRSPEGVRNGVVAHVNMVRQEDDGSIDRVHVQLREDGRVVGQLVSRGQYEEMTSLNGVFFIPGDTVFLDGMGEPYDSDNQPRPTREQELFFEREREEMVDSILGS
ncbi:hypothetical protein EGI94_10170 [Stutzerimonas stutzeri]|uniref:hypothetical protein n=1 Tax=Stutzerimonas stutzeri TaxID=316 RepID=UPI000F79A6FA|nr:hypothetical protein [Stutzerimonas stutzeri]MDH0424162.1 hypothetical protein [Stutzerimonas stutzeri]RRV33014.1 hypothetical protein EGI94_10170 [Stutzerimonas stutzeri]